MHKKFLSIASIVAVSSLPFAAIANDQGKSYISFKAGAVLEESSDLDSKLGSAAQKANFDEGFSIAAAYGYYFTNEISAELEIGISESEYEDFTVGNLRVLGYPQEALSIMANTYYTYPIDFPVQPYAGVGIGIATDVDSNDTAFAYQATVGGEFDINDSNAVFAGYRYFGTTELEDTTNTSVGRLTTTTELGSHILEIGYKFKF